MKNGDLKDIQIMKKLFILHMMKCGASSGEIRKILKMSGSRFAEFMPIKNVKKYK